MSGTHLHDGSSRASTTFRHPQDASDTHCLYRHPQDASNHADSKAVGKQQAFATLHGVLAKNPAILNGATARESHHYDASDSTTATQNDSATSRAALAEDTDDTYASSNGCNYVHRITNTERCAMGSNTSCLVIPSQQNVISTYMMDQNLGEPKYSGSVPDLKRFINRMESIIRRDDISDQHNAP